MHWRWFQWLVCAFIGCSSTSTNPGGSGVGGAGGASAQGGIGGATSGGAPDGGHAGSDASSGGLSGAGGLPADTRCGPEDENSGTFGDWCLAGTIHSENFKAAPTIFVDQIGDGTWKWVDDGTFQQPEVAPSESINWVGARSNWSNYLVEACVRIDGGYGAYQNAGFIFRASSTSEADYFGIGIEGLEMGHITAGQYQGYVLAYAPKVAIGSWHKLGVEAYLNRLKFYLDGNPIIGLGDAADGSIEDASNGSGSIGLRTFAASATYDWIKVTCK